MYLFERERKWGKGGGQREREKKAPLPMHRALSQDPGIMI